MTENTKHNKGAFLATYWGHECARNINGDKLDIGGHHIYNCGEYHALLKDLSQLTVEEAIKISLIKFPTSLGFEVTGRRIAANHHYHSREVADELRKMGFLIGWRDLSPEQIKAYGWAVTK